MQKLSAILRNQLIIIVISTLLIVISYQFADRSIVYWAESHDTRSYAILNYFTHLSDLIVALVLLIYPILLFRFYRNYPTNQKLIALANCFVITSFFANVVKTIFGRYWAATWINNNLSLLRDGAYGFNWLHGNAAYGSFPSGHVAVTTATMAIVWLAYPCWRWLAFLVIGLMVIGQVTLYYHFLSDAIAGALLGYLIGYNVYLYLYMRETRCSLINFPAGSGKGNLPN